MTVSTATVVTPCRNAELLIGPTVESLMAQTAVRSGRLRLQYLVRDGASTDATVRIVEDLAGEAATVVVAEDGSMYEALAAGLRQAEGQIVSYLNAGDVYAPAALDTVADVMEGGARWVMGMHVVVNDRWQPMIMRLPIRYRRRFLAQARYGSSLLPTYVQQESTFWRSELTRTVDLDRLATFRLAGDTYLWRCFASVASPVIVETYLGAALLHEGQLSEDQAGYRREAARLATQPVSLSDRMIAAWDRVERHAPARVRKRLDPSGFLRYDAEATRWA